MPLQYCEISEQIFLWVRGLFLQTFFYSLPPLLSNQLGRHPNDPLPIHVSDRSASNEPL